MVDKRRWSKDYSGEVCRVCGSRDVHSRDYDKPTMDCINYLKDEIKQRADTEQSLTNWVEKLGTENDKLKAILKKNLRLEIEQAIFNPLIKTNIKNRGAQLRI